MYRIREPRELEVEAAEALSDVGRVVHRLA